MKKTSNEINNITLFNEMHAQIKNNIPLEKNSARNALITNNEKLIHHIIHKYFFQHDDQEDLLMIGKIALVKAIDKFVPSKETKFSSYACKIIYNAICREFYLQSMNNRKIHRHTVSSNEEIYNQQGDPLKYEDTIYFADPSNFVDEYVDNEYFNIKKENLHNNLQYLTPVEQVCLMTFFNNSGNLNLTLNFLSVSRQRFYEIKDVAYNKIKLLYKNPSELTPDEKDKLFVIKLAKHPLTITLDDYKNLNETNTYIKRPPFTILALIKLKNSLKFLEEINLKNNYLNVVSKHLHNFVDAAFYRLSLTDDKKEIYFAICKYLYLDCLKNFNSSFDGEFSEYVCNRIYKEFDICKNNYEYKVNLFYKAKNTVYKNVSNEIDNENAPNKILNNIEFLKKNTQLQNIYECFKHLNKDEQNAFVYLYTLNISNTAFTANTRKTVTIHKYLITANAKINLLLKPNFYCTYKELKSKQRILNKKHNLINDINIIEK